MGVRDGRPKGAIAWKFGSEKTVATIIGVVWQIGLSGRYTPVVLINPVSLCGVTVSRATLHNVDIFKEFDLAIGDDILITRSGDVIPFIIEKVHDNGGEKLEIPTNCSVCGEELKFDGKFLNCVNDTCPATDMGLLIKWIRSLDLKNIGKSTVEALYSAELLKTTDDLYRLKVEDIEVLDGFGESSANKIINELNGNKEVELNKFIAGLNIPNFGSSMAKILMESGYDTLDKVLAITAEELVNIKGIAEKTAKSFISGREKRKNLIRKLLEVGITIKEIKKGYPVVGGKLEGKSFLFTGKIESLDENGDRYTRKKLQSLVESNGGVNAKSVSGTLDYLVTADVNSNSSKMKKARAANVNIITDGEFLAML
jgi:DNA ligase (NAD+)